MDWVEHFELLPEAEENDYLAASSKEAHIIILHNYTSLRSAAHGFRSLAQGYSHNVHSWQRAYGLTPFYPYAAPPLLYLGTHGAAPVELKPRIEEAQEEDQVEEIDAEAIEAISQALDSLETSLQKTASTLRRSSRNLYAARIEAETARAILADSNRRAVTANGA